MYDQSPSMPTITFFCQGLDLCYCEVVLLLEKTSSYNLNLSPLILTHWSHAYPLKQRTESGVSFSVMAFCSCKDVTLVGIFQKVSHWTLVPRDTAERYVMKWLGSQTGLENAELIEVTQVFCFVSFCFYCRTFGAFNKPVHQTML